jgi:DNA processing protein
MNSIPKNMNEIYVIKPAAYPYLLKEIDDLPVELYVRGEIPSDDHMFLTVVGSRKYTDYGKAVCESLIAGLKGFPVVIISGLAYGIDAIAHEAALENGIRTIAVPGSGISDDMLYPAANKHLAHRILEAGGTILSPFDETVFGNNWTFPFRNRIMAGMAHATLVIEADRPSGTLITSSHASEFNRTVCAVPGSIFSKKSAGPHMLISKGATPITCPQDLIEALGLDTKQRRLPIHDPHLTEEEKKIIQTLSSPLSRETLIERLGIPVSKANILISMLEIKGIIRESMGEIHLI